MFVLPSFYEGLPLVAIEAAAMEKAIVATAVDGTPEVVLNGETGLTVPPGDAPALAAAMSRLLADAALRDRLARTGREHVLRTFAEEQQVARTAEFYMVAWRECKRGRIADGDGARATEPAADTVPAALRQKGER